MKSNLAAAVLIAFSCAGCSMVLDDNSAVFSAAPGKYDYLDCKGIADRTSANSKRTAELDNLMQRANQGAGGKFVSTMVYKDEYNAVQADQIALRQVSDEKRCAPDMKALTHTGSISPMH
jgi:hypothetical protein